MTTNRPYRRAMTLDESCDELKAHAGTWYDPEYAYDFLDVVKDIYMPESEVRRIRPPVL